MSQNTVQHAGGQVPETLRGARRVAVIAVVVSLTIAAALGIIALFGGSWGDLQFKVMLTTLAVAAFSILALVNMALIQIRMQFLVWLTMLAALLGFVTSLLLLWWLMGSVWSEHADLIEGMAKACATGWVLAVAGTHGALMSFASRNASRVIKFLAFLTFLCAAGIAGQLLFLVFADLDFDGLWFFRIMGTLAILGVLGTVAVPVMARVTRPAVARQQLGAAAPQAPPVPPAPATLSPALLQRLRERAEAESTTPDALLERLLER